MLISSISMDQIALLLFTIYLGGTIAGAWILWRSSGKSRIWGLAWLIESAAAAVLLAMMSSRFWSAEGVSIIDIDVLPVVWSVASVFIPMGLGIAIVIGVVFLVVGLIKRRYSVVGRLLPALLIPAIFSISTVQLISRTEISRLPPPAPEIHREIKIGPGFAITPFIKDPVNIPTSIVFGPDNNLYVANYNGDIWGISTKDGTSWRYSTGFRIPVGLAWHDGLLYVASYGKVSIVRDEDGDNIGDSVEDIITDLPAFAYHSHTNNGLVFGPDNRLYFAVGSTSDHSPETSQYAASILSAEPDGSDLSVFAVGVRNPYRLAFNSKGELFATDNGPNALEETPGDELNQIIQGGDYGFPTEFGIPSPGSKVQSPVALFPPHASADGLVFYQGDQFPEEYFDNAFVTLWHFGEIYRVQLVEDEKGNYATRLSVFVSGLSNPLDLAVGPDGQLYVADFETNTIYKIAYVGGD